MSQLLECARNTDCPSNLELSMTEAPNHDPVMINEVFSSMSLAPGMVYLDGTVGLGGHSIRAAELISPGGTLIGIDRDESMLEIAKKRLSQYTSIKVSLHHSEFRNIPDILGADGLMADGILLDLGLNSAQLDDVDRGFSFQAEGPLDMRMDRSIGETASDLLNRLSLFEIETILFQFGDERWSRAIALKIVERRQSKPLNTTQDLIDCVLGAVPAKAREVRIHPATRTFQAVRIAVNREFGDLGNSIVQAAECLANQGVLVVLTYHSGEDKIVKNAFKQLDSDRFSDVYKKPLVPSSNEILINRRARSAKLRAIRRVSASCLTN